MFLLHVKLRVWCESDVMCRRGVYAGLCQGNPIDHVRQALRVVLLLSAFWGKQHQAAPKLCSPMIVSGLPDAKPQRESKEI
jgi:hypothetical protein